MATPPPRRAPARGCARRGAPRRWPRSSRSRRRATAGAGGSPARSAASCPQAAPTSWPRLRRMVVPIPASRRVAAKRSMTGIGLAVQGVWATGFIGMRLTWAWSPRSSSAIASASSVGVVDPADHRDLVADPPAGGAGVVARGRHDLRDRPAAVQRDEHVAQRIARRVERDGQRELRAERRQPPDPGDDPGGRDGDVARPEAEPRRVVERLDRGQHAIQVEQRLAHPHEHDVRQPLAVRRQPACGVADLVDDLGVSRSRANPSSPVAQNGQPTAQPAWLEMHSVWRSRLSGRGPGSASAPIR